MQYVTTIEREMLSSRASSSRIEQGIEQGEERMARDNIMRLLASKRICFATSRTPNS